MNMKQQAMGHIAKLSRTYDIDIMGTENIPLESGAVFICNHSNSHDFFTAQEVFYELKRRGTVFCANDCLNFLAEHFFRAGNAVLVNRADRKSTLNGLQCFVDKISRGEDGVIFSEATWNLHPVKPVLNMKIGGVKAALAANVCVVPTVFEYVEVLDIVSKESELYQKLIVQFGKPQIINPLDDLVSKTKQIQREIADMRYAMWEKLGIRKIYVNDVDKSIYLNHTYMKKFKAFGFEFDSEHEYQFLLRDKAGYYENEYIINQKGEFVPGIIHKKAVSSNCQHFSL